MVKFKKSISVTNIMPSARYPEAKLDKVKLSSRQNTLYNRPELQHHQEKNTKSNRGKI